MDDPPAADPLAAAPPAADPPAADPPDLPLPLASAPPLVETSASAPPETVAESSMDASGTVPVRVECLQCFSKEPRGKLANAFFLRAFSNKHSNFLLLTGRTTRPAYTPNNVSNIFKCQLPEF